MSCVYKNSSRCHCDCKWVLTPFHVRNVVKLVHRALVHAVWVGRKKDPVTPALPSSILSLSVTFSPSRDFPHDSVELTH